VSSIRSHLTDIFSDAFETLGFQRTLGHVAESARPDLGQFQCNGALAAAREAKQNPRAIAQKVIDDVKSRHSAIFAELSIAGAGFVNISVTGDFLSTRANALLSDKRLGVPAVAVPHTVVIDFGGPNVAKPMHVGHLRSAIIGDALQRIVRFLGENVISDNHLGDWGTQMGMLLCELQLRQPELPYFDASSRGPYPEKSPVSIAQLEEMYPTASKRCKSDEAEMAKAVQATAELQSGRPGYRALWKHFVAISVAELHRDFASIGIAFDHWLGESSYEERMDALVSGLKQSGTTELSDGAWVIHVAEPADQKEYPPLLLEKSGGGYLYATSDLATIQYRVEDFKATEILYVVDKRQDLHFTQVFRAARKLGIVRADDRLQHVGFGTMNGPDGKPFKTRQGGVMKLADLVALVKAKALERIKEAGVGQSLAEPEQEDVVNRVGVATLKFADLSNHRESDYVFDVEKFTQFEGKTGPYLLYTAVRIKSILRNASQKGIVGGAIVSATPRESGLILLLCSLPDTMASAREALLPNYLCDFAYSLAQEFNRFYRECHILNETDSAKQASWISLVGLVLAEMELVLGLLGIEIPERM
jgi:arginyl-tRNA synthetase